MSWLRRWRGWPDATWIEKLSKLLNFIATEAHNIPLSFHHKLKLPLKYRNDFCTVREKVKPKQSIPYSLLISTPKWSIYRLLTGAPTPPLVIYLPEVFEFIEIFLSLTFYLLDREHNLWISFKTFGWSFDFISLLVAKSKPEWETPKLHIHVKMVSLTVLLEAFSDFIQDEGDYKDEIFSILSSVQCVSVHKLYLG